MKLGGGENLEIKSEKKGPNIALAKDEKKLNLYAKQSYHIQGLNQARCGFYLSIAGAIIGFIIIVISLILIFFKNDGVSSIISMVGGTILESVSILFFSISNKANERVSDSFDKLRLDSNIVNSIELCKTIDDVHIKDEVKVKLALYLVGIKEEHICKYSRESCIIKTNNKLENGEDE